MNADWRDCAADYIVIGDPISHSLSPVIHQAAYDELGWDWHYQAVRLPLEELTEALSRLSAQGIRGANVTVPLKEATCRWCRDHGYRVPNLITSINTIDFIKQSSTNTDIPAFLETIRLRAEAGAKLLFLGIGGTSKSLLGTCLAAGYEVSLWNRTREKAMQFIAEQNLAIPILETPKADGFDLVINATSAGLSGTAPPVEWSGSGLAYDISYARELTPFLQDAESHGWKTLDGKEMLVRQAALSIEFWTGANPPKQAMMRAVHEHS